MNRAPSAGKPKTAAAVEAKPSMPPVPPGLRCWTCGGNHRKSDCPVRAGSGGATTAPGASSPNPTSSSGGATAARGGRGGGKGKGRGGSGGGKSSMPCWYWAPGECPMGGDCRFVHDAAEKGTGLPEGVTMDMVKQSKERAMSRSSSVASATSAAAYYDMPPMPDALQRKLCVGFRTNPARTALTALPPTT